MSRSYGRVCLRSSFHSPLMNFTQLTVQRIFLLQLVVFMVAVFIFSWTPFRLTLVPRALRRARARRAALEQFVVRHVTHTHNRCGILIFVSMAEHYARVIADEGIAQKVERSAEWQSAIDVLISNVATANRAAVSGRRLAPGEEIAVAPKAPLAESVSS